MNIVPKKWLKVIFSKIGYKLVKIKNDSPSKLGANFSPLTVSYLIGDSGVLIDADVKRGRGMPLHSYLGKSIHPFVFAVREAMNLEEKYQYNKVREILFSYYQTVSLGSIGDFITIDKTSSLYSQPAWAIVMPWKNMKPKEWKQHVIDSVSIENSSEGSRLGIKGGWAWFGPVGDEKLNIEAKRLMRVFQSIKTTGYRRHGGNDGDIAAVILVNDKGDWVWQSEGGQHRTAVLTALSWEYIPVRVSKVIRRGDVEYWPNVLNKTYTEKEALGIFDMIFYDSFNYANRDWITYTEQVIDEK